MSHFNTGPGLPQTRAEVEKLTEQGLDDFMALCDTEPADPENCLACYAYKVAQDREEQAKKKPRIIGRESFLMETLAKLAAKGVHARHPVTDLRQTDRGYYFEVQVTVDDEPTGHIARITVELDRLETTT